MASTVEDGRSGISDSSRKPDPLLSGRLAEQGLRRRGGQMTVQPGVKVLQDRGVIALVERVALCAGPALFQVKPRADRGQRLVRQAGWRRFGPHFDDIILPDHFKLDT